MPIGSRRDPDHERIFVEIDPDLEDLAVTFLEHRRTDVETIRAALEQGDYRSIHRLGHNLKGDSGALGFDGLTAVGRGLEQAALEHDDTAIEAESRRLGEYLQRVEVVSGSADEG